MQEPHLLPDKKTARNIRLFVFRQTAVKSDFFIPRDQDPTALAKPELVRVSSDELIGFGRPLVQPWTCSSANSSGPHPSFFPRGARESLCSHTANSAGI